MPKTKDYKQIAAKLQKEIDKLKQQLAVQFQKGVEQATKQAEKLQHAYDKYMTKAATEFHKKFKPSKAKKTTKKTTVKKAKPATAERRGRPSKKQAVSKSK